MIRYAFALLGFLLVGVATSCSNDRVSTARSDIAAEPGSLDFGSVVQHQRQTLKLTLANRGTAALSVSALEIVREDLAGQFQLPGHPQVPFTVEAGGSHGIEVSFDSPASEGIHWGTLSITSDAQNAPTLEVPLSGRTLPACGAGQSCTCTTTEQCPAGEVCSNGHCGLCAAGATACSNGQLRVCDGQGWVTTPCPTGTCADASSCEPGPDAGFAYPFTANTSGGATLRSASYRLDLFIAPAAPIGSSRAGQHHLQLGPAPISKKR